MATLTNFTYNSNNGLGDYNITMVFDDVTTSTQTIHFGVLTDGDTTAKDQLDALVANYAVAYQAGLAIEPQQPVATPASLTAIASKSQGV